MPAKILRKVKTAVQANSEKIFDPYEDLIAELHRFLDRLVAEPQEYKDFDPKEIFIERTTDEDNL